MQLRAEHLDRALGIGEREPRLSWRLPDGWPRQVAYEVTLDDGTTTRVEGDAHVLVPWPGKALASGERREVRVRVETEASASGPSRSPSRPGCSTPTTGLPPGSPPAPR